MITTLATLGKTHNIQIVPAYDGDNATVTVLFSPKDEKKDKPIAPLQYEGPIAEVEKHLSSADFTAEVTKVSGFASNIAELEAEHEKAKKEKQAAIDAEKKAAAKAGKKEKKSDGKKEGDKGEDDTPPAAPPDAAPSTDTKATALKPAWKGKKMPSVSPDSEPPLLPGGSPDGMETPHPVADTSETPPALSDDELGELFGSENATEAK